jgi:chemotaxis protein CheC
MSAGPREFSADVIDLLTELVNMGVGRAAASLSELVDCRVELSVPSVSLVRSRDWRDDAVEPAAQETVVVQEFSGELCGRVGLAFERRSSLALAGLLSGVDVLESELDVELTGVLLEVGNILLNSVMGTLANEVRQPLSYTLPTIYTGADCRNRMCRVDADPEEDLLIADVQFRVESREIQGSVVIVFACGSVVRLVRGVQPELLVA